MRMHTVGSRVAAARRTGGGDDASCQKSSESAMDGIGAKSGSVEMHPPALLRGEASKGADGGAVGWD